MFVFGIDVSGGRLLALDSDPRPVARFATPTVGAVLQLEMDRLARVGGQVHRHGGPAVRAGVFVDLFFDERLAVRFDD